MKKRVRIKDIAQQARVSTGTVDRVIHNRGKVAPNVKKRVLEVMEELGYERNLIASALAYNKQVRLLVLLPKPEQDPYWQQTLDGIQKASKTVQHYGVIIESLYFDPFAPKVFLELAKTALKTKIQGILFAPLFQEESKWLLEQCNALSIAAVMINTKIATSNALCYIGQDSYQSGVLAARLLDFGLQNGQTACILNLDFNTKSAQHLQNKEAGFRAYFAPQNDKQIPIIRRDFDGFQDLELFTKFMDELIDKYPNLKGIFITNSRAYYLANYLKQHPEHNIKIVGFDLIDANLEHLKNDTIHFLINQNPMQQGYEGILNLFRHLVLKAEISPLQYLPLDIVVKENVSYYLQRQIHMEVV